MKKNLKLNDANIALLKAALKDYKGRIEETKELMTHIKEMEKRLFEEAVQQKKEAMLQAMQFKLLEEHFRMRDSNVSFQTYQSWRKIGLLDTIEKDHKWAKFNFVELVWLEILESLRLMGCSYAIMQALKYELFTKAEEMNLAKYNLLERIDRLTGIERGINDKQHAEILACKKTLEDPLLMNTLRKEISYLYQHINSCLRKEPIDIFISIANSQKRPELFIGKKEEFMSKQNSMCKPHIYVSINYIVNSLLEEEKIALLLQE
jgi:hypothetical protein